MSEWTDEVRNEVIAAYEAANPTPENSVEIVKDIAEQFEKTPNGVRMVLTKAGVYVKKAAPTGGSTKSSDKSKSTRVSKADAMDALVTSIEATGQEPDMDIISKLTGKACAYFAEVIKAGTDSE